MAKTQATARKRRPYEYDHHYGLLLQSKGTAKAKDGNVSSQKSTARSVKKKSARKR